MLLAGRPSLRFTKLENRSPATEPAAIKAPTCQSNPISQAASGFARIEKITPLTVFAGPNRGWPTGNGRPPSTGWANRSPSPFLANNRGPVGHDEEDQELKEQSRMHGAVLWPRKRPGP